MQPVPACLWNRGDSASSASSFTTASMLARSLIERKRDGGRLTREEWQALADAYLRGELADYQMSAFLMAAFIRGLDEDETVSLTRTMLESGDRLRLAEFGTARIDKHSTGGVGDKVSLVLAPLVASCGEVVSATVSDRRT